MVKDININATYNNRNKQFQLNQRDFLQKAAEYFNFDVRDVELYLVQKGQRKRITHHEITDLMKIDIVDKNSILKNGQQRTINSYYENESPEVQAIENVITKLTQNNPLTGQERKNVIQWLQIYSSNLSLKRKRDEDVPSVKKSHKKVQVNPYMNCKESFAQTNFVSVVPDETPAQEEHMTDKIKKLAGKTGVEKEKISAAMRDSFDERRNFILIKIPPVIVVRDKYPLLFSLEEIKNELGRIFYAEKCEEFYKNMHKYAPFINKKYKSEDLWMRTQKSIDRARTDVQKKYAEVVGSVFILTDLMEEEWRFIHLQDFPHGSDDIYPHIDASYYSLKEIFFDGLLFRVKVEGIQLCEATNLLEAILCLVAAFFIFNIDYPPSCRRTMILFEKLYLGANDTADIDEYTIQMLKLLELEAKHAK